MRKRFDSEALTVLDAAEVAGVSVSTVKNWYRSGKLPGYRLPGTAQRNGPARFRLQDVRRLQVVKRRDPTPAEIRERAKQIRQRTLT